MHRPIRSVPIALVVLSAGLAGCGAHPGPPSASGFPPPCRLLSDASQPADTITVALPGPIDPTHAPGGRTAGERLLFRQLYETLIEIDCLGRAGPALAASWKPLDGGRAWRIDLRPGARFTDGTPVTAGEVARSWQEMAPGALTEAGIESVSVIDGRTLEIGLARPTPSVPRSLADPSLAIAGPHAPPGWPSGTGPYRIDPSEAVLPGRPPERILTASPVAGSPGPVIRFTPSGTKDSRDLLDGGVDLLITEDPAVIDYASVREGIDAIALPWDRVYLLLSTSRVRALQRGKNPTPLPPDLTGRLAADAVRVEARVPRFPDGWAKIRDCGDLRGLLDGYPPFPAGSLPGARPRRIIYPAEDRVARDLAERILALGRRLPSAGHESGALRSTIPGLTGTGGVAAVGLDRPAFEAALETGAEFAYVVPAPARPIDTCLEVRRLVRRAPWIALEGVDLEEIVLPLVETRRRLIAIRGRVGVAIDGLGDLRITKPGFGGDRAR